jgi:hypothetical protein
MCVCAAPGGAASARSQTHTGARTPRAQQLITSAAEAHSPVKPSALLAASVDLEGLGADDLEYNYDMAGLAGARARARGGVTPPQGGWRWRALPACGLLLVRIVRAPG